MFITSEWFNGSYHYFRFWKCTPKLIASIVKVGTNHSWKKGQDQRPVSAAVNYFASCWCFLCWHLKKYTNRHMANYSIFYPTPKKKFAVRYGLEPVLSLIIFHKAGDLFLRFNTLSEKVLISKEGGGRGISEFVNSSVDPETL